MKKFLIKLSIVMCLSSIFLTGCFSGLQNQTEKLNRELTASDYLVIQWSGGKAVHYWIVTNKVVNNEENSDGYYWFDNGRQIRVSGEATVIEIKGLDTNSVLKEYGLNK